MPLVLPKRLTEQIDQFAGRTWLLPRILDWVGNKDNERIGMLTGGPGKSMILAWLAGHGPLPTDQIAVKPPMRI